MVFDVSKGKDKGSGGLAYADLKATMEVLDIIENSEKLKLKRDEEI